MRLVIQRVRYSQLSISHKLFVDIGVGLVVFIGFGVTDDSTIFSAPAWSILMEKLATLQVFPDENGKMYYSVEDIGGEILLVPQVTLYGDCGKGRRPSFHNVAAPEVAESLFMRFFEQLSVRLQGKIQKGVFGADMDVNLVNWGPVTLLLDSTMYH